MILVDETAVADGRRNRFVDSAIRELRLEVDRAWRNDVALEMWIDVTSEPVAIRLEGVLDESTGANLLGVVRTAWPRDDWTSSWTPAPCASTARVGR